MTIIEKKKLLNDKWPEVSAQEKSKLMSVIQKASEARIFKYEDDEQELARSVL